MVKKRVVTAAVAAVILVSGPLVAAPVASATTAGGNLRVGGTCCTQTLTGPVAAGSTPSIATPPSGATYQVVYQGANGDLFTTSTTSGPTDLNVKVADGTSPSLAEFPSGGWEALFQNANGQLWGAGTGFGGNLNVTLAPGTSPSVSAAGSGGGFHPLWTAAEQGRDGNLWITTAGATNTDTHMAMMAGTSPSLTLLGGLHVEVAYEGSNGDLWIYGSNNPGDQHVQMATGTSPAIISYGTGFLVAYHGVDGNLITYGQFGEGLIPTGARDWFSPMVPGTNPSLVDVNNMPLLTFQMADTALAPFGEVITFLPVDAAGQTQEIDDGGVGVSPGTSIAELRNGGYEAAFVTP